MTVVVKHNKVCGGQNDPTKEISRDAWNEYHVIEGLGTAAESDASAFATAGHNHDATYAAAVHAHDYAASDHNHDGTYAAAAHNHDASYAGVAHDHDADYAAIDHTHPGGGSALDAWPVGSVYIAVDSTNPATKFGGGTWSQIAAGRMLVGVDANDADFNAAEKIGGAKTSSAVVDHTHAVTITDPGHTHVENSNNATTGSLRGWGAADTSTGQSQATGYSTASATTGISATTANPAGGVASFSLMNPFFAVYLWKRTA